MKKVLTYGTFDLFHIGHLKILERAKSLGDYLVVGVSTDEFNALKNKKCALPYWQRIEIVRAIRFVDKAIPETNWEQKIADIKENGIDIFVMGDDWVGRFDFLKPHCKVVYLPRTPDISSTGIKTGLAADKDNFSRADRLPSPSFLPW
ncbi:MAG: glycerol-3-phosphate cytidylyltransferase [Desulfuromonadaceae bacterium]|nr:glycerol-3-phosphate cytidylyltransferase [Desulfuromonadaceae bacterium]MDD5104911.1 glycerol-3-phosphate cytidylyltransferase [Desulfuromonadaceae bacterium]